MDYVNMLCNRAGEWYGWDIRFAGDFISGPLIEITPWVNDGRDLPISIGREHQPHRERMLYGFVGQRQPGVLLFHPFACDYSGEGYDSRSGLVSAALLHLRKKVSSRRAYITFPESLAGLVDQHHLDLLLPNNLDVRRFDDSIMKYISKPMTSEDAIKMLNAHLASLRR